MRAYLISLLVALALGSPAEAKNGAPNSSDKHASIGKSQAAGSSSSFASSGTSGNAIPVAIDRELSG